MLRLAFAGPQSVVVVDGERVTLDSHAPYACLDSDDRWHACAARASRGAGPMRNAFHSRFQIVAAPPLLRQAVYLANQLHATGHAHAPVLDAAELDESQNKTLVLLTTCDSSARDARLLETLLAETRGTLAIERRDDASSYRPKQRHCTSLGDTLKPHHLLLSLSLSLSLSLKRAFLGVTAYRFASSWSSFVVPRPLS